MGEFVQIRTSPADIVTIANSIRSRGEALERAVAAHLPAIEERERREKTFPPDEFTGDFHEQYTAAATGVRGTPSTVNQAVREAALFCAEQLTHIGEYVAGAMATYDVTDQQGGADIAAAGHHDPR
ncbi:hypothetical protein [Actinoplanes palleronii]|uniref:PE domain-containing protein n=1 Tax=Actinoplanes palleronii TaxID=113570 RepID=A0ABQ4B2C6_9ACTN|nr:hypothetical protein [Actinoplanes palleronii]GIE64828.1 hypothetical protein Apa02nite_009360 [Actinoplanes palleronii]